MSSEMPVESGQGINRVNGCRRESFYIDNCQPGKKLYARYWYPKDESTVKGLVFLCHGYSEHLGYYDEFANIVASLGMIAFGHDHPGHGLSDGARGTISDVNQLVDEVLVHSSKMKLQYPKLPCFLFGHSMGGLVAIKAVLRNRSFFRGLVLEGPLIIPTSKPSFIMTQVSKIARILIPDYIYAKMDLHDVTRDQAAISRMEKDPLRWHGGVNVETGAALYDGFSTLSMQLLTIPFLILHAEEDKLCDVEGSRTLYKKCKSKDKQLITFPNAGHNLFLEQGDIRLQAMTESANWFSTRARRLS